MAGIAKGTVYLYFKGKNELLNAVVDYSFDPLIKVYEGIVVSEVDPLPKLEQIVFKSMAFTENNKKIFYEVRNIMFNTLDKAIGDEKSWYWQTINLISGVLDEAVRSGKIRSINTVKFAALFFESINTLMSHRIFTKVEDTIEEDTRDIMELFIKGLSK